MKKTQLLVLLKNIWATKVSFISIVLFVALGIAIFTGIKWNQPSFINATDEYYQKQDLYDFSISFPYGVTDDDIEAINALNEVTLTEGGYSADGLSWIDKTCYVLTAKSISEKMSHATAVEGVLPTAPNEIGIEADMSEKTGLGIGDTLTIQSSRGGGNSLLNTDFIITAIVAHPAYITIQQAYTRGATTIADGEIDFFMLVSESAFNKEAYDNCYSNAYVRCDSLRGLNSFDEEYNEKSKVIAESIKKLGESLGLARYTSVYNRYQLELDDAEQKINDAERQISDAEKEIAEAEKEIADKERAIAGGEEGIKAAEAEIAKGEKAIAAAQVEIAENEKKIADGEREIKAAERELAAAEAEINDGTNKLAAANAELAAGTAEYNKSAAALADAKAEIEDSTRKVNNSLTKVSSLLEQTPQEFQDTAAKYFAQYGVDSKNIRLSDESAVLKGQLENLSRLLDKLILDVDNKIQALNNLSAMIEDYRQKYANSSDTSEKQNAFAKLSAALSAENINNTDLDAASEEIAIRLSDFTPLQNVLRDSKQQLINYIDKINQYLQGESELTKAKKDLDNASAEINKNTKLLEQSKSTFNKKKSEFEAAKAKLSDAKQELADGKAELESNIAKLNEGKIEIEKNKTAIAEGDSALEEGKKKILESKAELEGGKTELESNKKELDKAKADFAKLTPLDSWNVEKRSDNMDYIIAQTYSNSGQKLCYSLSLLFVFVGVMICYTAVSRIVHEQQILTGVQKSLGFTRKEITAQYMSYAVLAVMLGAVLGGILGYFVIESIVNNTFEPMFVMGSFEKHFNFIDLLIISGVELVLICFAAWLACHQLLSRQAVDLLRENNKTTVRTRFYEKQRWWKHCSLYTQTTINNLVNDKTRVIATLVGVAGCTALVVVAVTVQAALVNTPKKHFSEVCLYDQRLISDDDVPGAMDALSSVLAEENVEYTEVFQKGFLIEDANGEFTVANVIVPSEPMNLHGYIRLTDEFGGKSLSVPEDGILISHSYTKYHDVGVGDSITLVDTEGKYHTCVIAGVTEHHLSSVQVVMSAGYYETVSGKNAADNTFLINMNGILPQELEAKLNGTSGYLFLSDDKVIWTDIFEYYQRMISVMVYIAFFLSTVMALLVLLNLNVVLINEKVKELIVMRINGFSVGAAKKYVYRDNIVLTLLGTLIGVGVGIGLGALVILSVIDKMTNIILDPSPLACLVGVGISVFFAVITNFIALQRVGKFRVSDLNK